MIGISTLRDPKTPGVISNYLLTSRILDSCSNSLIQITLNWNNVWNCVKHCQKLDVVYWKYCWADNLNINSKVQSISGLSPSVSFATMVFQEYTGNKTKKAFVCVCHPDKTVKESLYLIQPSINIVLRQLHLKTFYSLTPNL